jgi:glycosyltransferase involved in cell wall biosynthesis
MKILVLTSRRRKPSYRYRIAQFLPDLESRGVTVQTIFLARRGVRFGMVLECAQGADVVIVQKRLLRRIYLKRLRKRARRLIYDVDDAVWCKDDGTPSLRLRKRFERTVRSADLVLAGNSYLAGVARDVCDSPVQLLPTVVDTEHYSPPSEAKRIDHDSPFVLGWIGSTSTNTYLRTLLQDFPAPMEQERSYLLHAVSGSSEGLDSPSGLSFQFTEWSSDREVPILRSFDAGVMPLPDNTWTRGKCGMKALLYMATGLPCVVSPVGVNRDIVIDGETGFVASDSEGWRRAFRALANDEDLRVRMGRAARERAVGHWSKEAISPVFLQALDVRSS